MVSTLRTIGRGSQINNTMNYEYHYNLLIERARYREIYSYTELHHIIPKCMGGKNSKENLVRLTPEEHYVAHQLLCKIYPLDRKLIHAACMMTVSGDAVVRNNKLYGWLRRRLSSSAKLRKGIANGSTGKPWYHNPETSESGKYIPGTEPTNWSPGRVPALIHHCLICNKETEKYSRRYCDSCRPKKKKTVFRSIKLKDNFTDEEKLKALENKVGNIRQALFSLGLNDSGENYRMMKKLNATVYPHATNVSKG
jgi:hypothetical protein